MTGLETNSFPIKNLQALSSRYRLYHVRGLNPEHDEYHQNCQTIIKALSFRFQTPATVLEKDGVPHLVLREDAPEPPSPMSLVRATAYFEQVPGVIDLDYTVRAPETDEICLRFLNFSLQSVLWRHPQLWQLGSGTPFFEKDPAEHLGDIVRYAGFAVRAMFTPDGGIGLCVDLRNRFIASRPLPAHMSKDEFRKWQGQHFIYHYGHNWLDVKLQYLSDLTVSELMIPDVDMGQEISLLEWIVKASEKPIPKELSNLSYDATVAHYYNNREELRAAPIGLCYRVYDSQDAEVQRNQKKTTPPPHIRRRKIHEYVEKYLRSLRFGDTRILVDKMPADVPQRMFTLPDYEFGNGHIVSVRGTTHAQHVSLDQIGRTRLALLQDIRVGFYVKDPLARQYLFLPQTVYDSWGVQYIEDLTETVHAFFGSDQDDELFPVYDPIIVPYNDMKPKTFVDQGNAILAAAKKHCTKDGYALVMIHHTKDRKLREPDQLAAMVMHKLATEFDIRAAVNHSAVGEECYRQVAKDGHHCYEASPDKMKKLTGYLRNVVLNKILLTNERWPFILHTPLHADLTIGIDVKHHTAGFTLVSKRGDIIRSLCSASSQKEKLSTKQVRAKLIELISAEANHIGTPIRHIVIHRDGRSFPPELRGAREAIAKLSKDGIIAEDASLTVLEIAKTAPSPLRLFDITESHGGQPWVNNPQVGNYHVRNHEGYLCTTGRAFPHQGTTRPLHIRYIEGTLPFEECLEDIYFLSALAWTRPEDCCRNPITIKLTDRRLSEDATEYDADALEFHLDEAEEDEE